MSYKSLTLFAVVSICLARGRAQTFSPGKCPPVKIAPDFDSQRFKGRWYEYARTPRLEEHFGKCIYYDFLPESTDGIVIVYRHMILPVFNIEDRHTALGKVVEPGHVESWKGDTYVLGTDYENYAVIYLCTEYFAGILHSDVIFILTRQAVPSDMNDITKALRIIKENGLSTASLSETEQKQCPSNDKG